MARPTKRTPEVEDAIVLGLTKGWTRKAAAAAAGIGYSTLREWELAFPEFSALLEKAEEVAQTKLLATIEEASRKGTVTTRPDGTVIESPGSWQAAAWILERRWSATYARREHVTVDMSAVIRQVAAEAGVDEAEAIAEAERILAGG